MITVITPPQPFVTPADIPGSHAVDDPVITAMIAAAVGEIDGPYGWLGRSIGKQTLEVAGYWSNWWISLPLPPIIRIVSAHFTDTAGIETEIDTASYFNRREAIVFTQGAPFFRHCTSLRVRYEAGFSQEDGTGPIPPQVKQAVIMSVQNMKALAAENLFLRSEQVEGVGTFTYTVSEQAGSIIRNTAERLLRGLKVQRT
ncbi:hypothetical protein [Shinella kummerowiae]|uniref:hypothetical protein n=1 Tax=Shinella kummerowiae TaxID=417745 RepID=UPI0021B629F3|nr:hypothetical protein [Shinella kummerowiae]MCT7665672.1 hypothetical protein [Shinella kummerowiae]